MTHLYLHVGVKSGVFLVLMTRSDIYSNMANWSHGALGGLGA